MDIHGMGELWHRVYELGNQVGQSWRLRYDLGKQAEKSDGPKCVYNATGQPGSHPICEQPAEYCQTEPVSSETQGPRRLYWFCRQHAELRDAEEKWGDYISDLLEWERVLDKAQEKETKEEIVALLEKRCGERRGLCDEFAAYIDSLRYLGKGKHPLK